MSAFFVLQALMLFLGATVLPEVDKEAAQLTAELLKTPVEIQPNRNSEAYLPLRNVGHLVWALELAGNSAEAEGLLDRCLLVAKEATQTGRPAGSLPDGITADNKPISPRCVVDAQAVSSLLEGAWRHASALPTDRRAEWFKKWWPTARQCGDFVAGWTRGARGEPYPAYDPTARRDIGGPREAIGALIGVMCAQQLAALAGEPAPETWKQRREALEILMRTTDFSEGNRPDSKPPWGIPNLRGLLPEDHPLWNAKVSEDKMVFSVREFAWRDRLTHETNWYSNPALHLIALLAPKPPEVAEQVKAALQELREGRSRPPKKMPMDPL